MIKRVVTMMVALAVICGAHGAPYGGWLSGAEAATIQLPQTGQTSCYDAAGTTIACAGTGQDGELKMGVTWPDPRFFDNGNGTISDKLTGLVWLKNANCFGNKDWATALSLANALANGQCGLSDGSVIGEWRLPNILELQSLVHEQQAIPANWLNLQGFNNVQADHYLSSSTYAITTSRVWSVGMNYGGVDVYYDKTYNYGVWPVRNSKTASAVTLKLPKTGQTTCYNTVGSTISCGGTGQDGELQDGIAWPNSRFSDNGVTNSTDMTITDNLTGLIWTKDAHAPGPTACAPATTKDWQSALTYVKCLNSNNYLGKNDWRLPNNFELLSLVNFGQIPSTWLSSQGFLNAHSDYYWSSSTIVGYSDYAWFVHIGYGNIGYNSKTRNSYVWPVRGGQTSAIVTNAACGAANLTSVTAAPTTDFCTSGTASAITGSGPWYWTCNGINGGTSIACVANATTLPADPTTTTSKVYMGTNDRFTASNSGITIYGGAGYDTVTISDGISGVTLDQNVERINFSGAAGNYTFKQTGNRINIYNSAGTLLLASAPVQGDADGTLLGFSNGTASALVNGGVMTVGGALVSTTTAGAISPTLK